MIVSRIPRDAADLERSDFTRSVLPQWGHKADAPFNIRRVTLIPDEITAQHNHPDFEVWIVLDGVGEVQGDGRTCVLSAGDSVYLPALTAHSFRNLSSLNPLSFFSVWWENSSALSSHHAARSIPVSAPERRPYLLLPSFPTPNGELHLGHLSGPFLNADACRRGLRATGQAAHLLLGTVGYQSQVAAAAEAEGTSFLALAERNTDAIVEGLGAAEIEWDVFVRPSEPSYEAMAISIFTSLRDRGLLVKRTEPTNFCTPCDRYLLEAFVSGQCPHCGSSNTAGIECEQCALPYNDSELLGAACAICGTSADQRPLTRYFLPLEPIRSTLEPYLQDVTMHSKLRAYVDRVLAKPLPDLPVTIPAHQGIPIEVENAVGPGQQRMYSAFELAARFLVALDIFSGDWESYARREDPRTILFFGFDNAFLRSFAFPAVLGSFTDALALPEAFICNDLYLLDGEKFSTSRKHAVWARRAVNGDNSDQLRLYLASTAPDVRRRDFTVDGYARFVQHDLIGSWQSWIDGVGLRTAENFDGCAPEPGGWNIETDRFYTKIKALCLSASQDYDPGRFKPREIMQSIDEFIRHAQGFAEISSDEMGDTRIARTYMALELMAVRALSMAIGPIAPNVGREIGQGLGCTDILLDPTPQWVQAEQRVQFSEHYFSTDTQLRV